jgi:hypothetical protein
MRIRRLREIRTQAERQKNKSIKNLNRSVPVQVFSCEIIGAAPLLNLR